MVIPLHWAIKLGICLAIFIITGFFIERLSGFTNQALDKMQKSRQALGKPIGRNALVPNEAFAFPMNKPEIFNFIFESPTFEFHEEPSDIPPGKDTADFLHAALKRADVDVEPIVKSIEGWEFSMTIEGRRYVVFLTWAPRNATPACYWVLQLRVAGLFNALWKRESSPISLRVLHEVLSNKSEIQNGRWINDSELQRFY